jgi:long-chain-fatty-acid--CoA ligase ACSBG
VVDTDEQLDKILEIRDKLPNLKAVVQILPSSSSASCTKQRIYKWSELEEMNTVDVETVYRERLAKIKANACCSIVYTSGTTGLYNFFTLLFNNSS